uniref:Uncharacterized protein n=2 Tax=Oryza sativa subsp. japonica TaxID=39947 RepID=Q851F7_ORYSJ|nr:hypothetical protein [Oryza sativa Japonica Group]
MLALECSLAVGSGVSSSSRRGERWIRGVFKLKTRRVRKRVSYSNGWVVRRRGGVGVVVMEDNNEGAVSGAEWGGTKGLALER